MFDAKPIQDVIVLGGGTAGLFAALALKTRLPELSVTVLRSKELGVIGVGEGTTAAVPPFLHGYLNIDPKPFFARAHPTWKLGIRFLWGRRASFNYTFARQTDWKWDALPKNNGYYCRDDFEFVDVPSSLMHFDKAFVRQPNGDPLIGLDVAYHLENATFVEFLESHASQVGVELVDDTVSGVERGATGVTALVCKDGRRRTADLYVDCSGFRSELLGRTLDEPFVSFKSSLFCERAVVGGWDRQAGETILPYTTAETMNAGWSWRIDHETRVNRGYVYAPDFITDEQAEREFREKNPMLVGPTRVVRFVSGRYRRAWVRNVIAMGNACGFVEPLEATSLATIADECRALAETLADCDRRPTPSAVAVVNDLAARAWDSVRKFLAIHYRFNDRLDTPFWQACRAEVDLAGAEPLVEHYRQNGPSTLGRAVLVDSQDFFGMEGYLTLLVGQCAPTTQSYQPSPDELARWEQIRAGHRTLASDGIGVAEALQRVRCSDWNWRPDFYRVERPSPDSLR